MDIIVSLFTTYFLYRTLFSAPIDAPSSLYNRITDGDLTSPDCSTLKEAFINFASFLVGFIIIGAIQSLLMNNFAPQRSEVLDEISITVLVKNLMYFSHYFDSLAQDYSVHFPCQRL